MTDLDTVESVVSKSIVRRFKLQMTDEQFAKFLSEEVSEELLKRAIAIKRDAKDVIVTIVPENIITFTGM